MFLGIGYWILDIGYAAIERKNDDDDDDDDLQTSTWYLQEYVQCSTGM